MFVPEGFSHAARGTSSRSASARRAVSSIVGTGPKSSPCSFVSATYFPVSKYRPMAIMSRMKGRNRPPIVPTVLITSNEPTLGFTSRPRSLAKMSASSTAETGRSVPRSICRPTARGSSTAIARYRATSSGWMYVHRTLGDPQVIIRPAHGPLQRRRVEHVPSRDFHTFRREMARVRSLADERADAFPASQERVHHPTSQVPGGTYDKHGVGFGHVDPNLPPA